MPTLLGMVVGADMILAAAMSLAQDAKVPAPKSASATTRSGSPKMAQMDEHIAKMQALHEKIATAATPGERQGLMAEQRQEMQQGMEVAA